LAGDVLLEIASSLKLVVSSVGFFVAVTVVPSIGPAHLQDAAGLQREHKFRGVFVVPSAAEAPVLPKIESPVAPAPVRISSPAPSA